jgi:hypothetical protein
MVDGCKKIVVVDLDGTLVDGNTLAIYLSVGFRYLAKQGRVDKALAVAALVVARKLRLISHHTMKYSAISLIGRDGEMLKQVAKTATSKFNAEVLRMIAKYRSDGCEAWLATAAPAFYARLLWDGVLIASPDGGPDCAGTIKRDAVYAWARKNNAEICTFLTDHSDDLPLAKAVADDGGRVVLVNPSPLTLSIFEAAIPAEALSKL